MDINDFPQQTAAPGPPAASVEETMVAPNNPPWNGWVAIGFWILSVIFVVFVPGIFLVPYVISQGIDVSDREALMSFVNSDRTAVFLQLGPVILAHLLTLGVGWLIVTKFNRYSFRKTLGWELNGFRWWHAGSITIAFYVFAYLMTLIFGHVENDFDRLIAGSRTAVYLVAILATFTAPLVEEVVYRGVLYSAFQRRLGFTAAVIVVTVLFTAVHVPQYSENSVPDLGSIVTLLFLSLTLTLIRAGTGNLLPSIVLHTIFNGLQSLLLILEPLLPGSSTTTPDPTGAIFHLLK